MKKTAVATLLLASLFAGQAFAHAKLTAAMPAADSAGASPKSIMLHFNEKLESKFSRFTVTGPDGKAVALTPAVDATGTALTAAVAAPLAAGSYKVDWRAATADGHAITGTYSFTVK